MVRLMDEDSKQSKISEGQQVLNLTHDQEMKLSELLFKALDMGCWHEWEYFGVDDVYGCYKDGLGCQKDYTLIRPNTKQYRNPNLFTRSAFLDVFDAVKDRGTLKEFLEGDYIHIDGIVSPDFQYELLKWLLEKDGRLGELEEVMEGE